MMKDQYTNKLNKFLSSDKAEQQSALFKKWIREDSTFADEVALYRKLEAEFADTEKQKLREELQQLGNKYFTAEATAIHEPVTTAEIERIEEVLKAKISWKTKIRKFKYCLIQIAAVGIIFIVSATVILPLFRNEKVQKEKYNNKNTEKAYIGKAAKSPETSKTIPPEIQAPIVRKEEPTPEENQHFAYMDNSIADGQYAKSKMMQSLSQNHRRSASFQIEMETLPEGDYKIIAGKTYLELAAEIVFAKTMIPANLTFKVFNNKDEDYIKDKYVLEAPLKLTEKGTNTYSINFNGNVQLKHGLYYYMIESTKGDLLYAGEFTAGKSEFQAKKSR